MNLYNSERKKESLQCTSGSKSVELVHDNNNNIPVDLKALRNGCIFNTVFCFVTLECEFILFTFDWITGDFIYKSLIIRYNFPFNFLIYHQKSIYHSYSLSQYYVKHNLNN
jgi:hypothetical protein